jgi:hypothetical protein
MFFFSFHILCSYHQLFGINFCCRSSNRDPGARAADSLSPKDHEGGSLSYNLKFLYALFSG